MKISSTSIEGLLLIEPEVFRDQRGYFFESFNSRAFNEATGLDVNFVQDNESCSAKGVIRGLHFQVPPAEQGKLVRVTRGAVVDVAVDLRVGSPTFGRHLSFLLSAENKFQLWIPPGFAHGFQTLEDQSIFNYKCTGFYASKHERSLRFDDANLGIEWPLDPVLMSEKDRSAAAFADFDSPFKFDENP